MFRSTLLLFAAACLASCGGEAPRPAAGPAAEPAALAEEHTPFLNTRTDVAYTGDEACFTCHEDEYRGYQEHGMAQSFYPLTPDNVVEAFPGAVLFHEASGYYYRAIRQDGRFYQEEYRLNAVGEKTHRLLREMKYVIGSGTAARTYLAESNGRLYELPLTWYVQKQQWDFSPGYREQNARFSRLVPERCMGCHNSYPEAVAFTEGKYTEVPHGIGCERCHGPGELHVEARLASPEASGAVDYTIVNPKHLPLDLRLDVCQQCHLLAEVSLLREGHTAFDFRPSKPLAAHLAFFTPDEPSDRDEVTVISHAERMQQSDCFLETRARGGEMDCMTCHNPHEGFRTKGPDYFNASCMECHAAAGLGDTLPEDRTHTAGANCISCHMPKVEAEDAPHASFTDHWIRVVREEPDVAVSPAGGAEELVSYWHAQGQGRADPVTEAMAYVIYGTQTGRAEATERGIELLEATLAEDPAHGEAQYLLGFAHLRRGAVEEAIPALEEAVRLGPSIPERLNTLAQAYEAGGRDPVTIGRLYSRALSIQPALADVRVNYGRFMESQGRVEEAIEQYRQAAAEQPWLAAAHFNLGTAYLRKGNLEEAEASLKRAIELDPGYAEARGNLGLLYLSRGQPEQALAQFEEGVAAAPGNPLALNNLGSYYVNEGRSDEAIPLLERAVRADPRYVDALANLALAYLNQGNPARARHYAQQALDVDPAHRLAREILAAL